MTVNRFEKYIKTPWSQRLQNLSIKRVDEKRWFAGRIVGMLKPLPLIADVVIHIFLAIGNIFGDVLITPIVWAAFKFKGVVINNPCSLSKGLKYGGRALKFASDIPLSALINALYPTVYKRPRTTPIVNTNVGLQDDFQAKYEQVLSEKADLETSFSRLQINNGVYEQVRKHLSVRPLPPPPSKSFSTPSVSVSELSSSTSAPETSGLGLEDLEKLDTITSFDEAPELPEEDESYITHEWAENIQKLIEGFRLDEKKRTKCLNKIINRLTKTGGAKAVELFRAIVLRDSPPPPPPGSFMSQPIFAQELVERRRARKNTPNTSNIDELIASRKNNSASFILQALEKRFKNARDDKTKHSDSVEVWSD